MKPVVAILGAGGFIGNRLVEMLHLEGTHAVRPVVRRPESLALAGRFAIDGRIADACDETALAAAFAGCHHVIHAIAGPPEEIVAAVAPVYRAAEAAGVQRMVYLSSASVHGQAPAPGTDETSPLEPQQPIAYNGAKVTAERILQELRRGGKVETVSLRPGIVHGPRSYWTGGFADELLAGAAYLVGGGLGICNAIYVDNLVEAVCRAMEVPAADGEAYIVGDAETVTWADLCRPIAVALGCDLASISVPAPSPQHAGKQPRDLLRASGRRLPIGIRRAWRAALAELRPASPTRGQTLVAPGPRGITVSHEKHALHTCATRLPMDKARRELGYAPPIDFETACRHAIAWLRFADYPLATPEGRPDADLPQEKVAHAAV
jgi:2-alkyl-3-oxoalkanoate reductase